jgi:glycosyltransferase involved in cell wall biosynthesis
MKVLMLADGSSIHARRALDWHLQHGCEVTFVDFQDPRPGGAERYRYLPYPGLRGARYLQKLLGQSLTGWLAARTAARRLNGIYRSVRPDVVHLYQIDHRAHHCFLAGLRPLVLSSWGTDINQHFTATADPDYRSRTATALAAADLVIADAADIVAKCSRLAGRTLPAALLPFGVNTELFRPGYEEAALAWRTKLGIPADARVLFSIRALTPLYGHHHVLEAFHKAQPRFRSSTFLAFKAYNNQGASEYEHQLRHHAEQLGLADRVRWSEGVPFEQLPALYAAADVIVNYPAMDGFPVTFLEAAACERPVVSNRLPSYAGTLAEKFFRLVEPEDPGALAEGLADAANEAVQDRKLGLAQARAVVENEYSETVTANRLMELYRRLARG